MGDIEIFFDYELMIDLVSHSLIPKHEILSESEEKDYLNSYQTKDSLRRILTMDPVARYYRMKDGNIVRVIRPSLATGNTVSYLLVVNGLHSHPILKNS
jgi:DNA-directed RNA polymerase I, II, and III subunit RPABC1